MQVGWWWVRDLSQNITLVITACTQLLPFLAKHSIGIRPLSWADHIIRRAYTVLLKKLKLASSKHIACILWMWLFPLVFSSRTVSPIPHHLSGTPFIAHTVSCAAWRADRSLLKLAALYCPKCNLPNDEEVDSFECCQNSWKSFTDIEVFIGSPLITLYE